MKRRLLAMALSLVMLVGLFPTAAMATDEVANYQHPRWWLTRVRRRWPAQWEADRQACVDAVAALKMGDPRDEQNYVGPMARFDLRDELHQQVTATLDEGATLLLGAEKIEGAGNYYAPTVLGNVTAGMTGFRQELFGPVAAITVAKNVEHALALANDSDFGLSATVFTADEALAQKMASRLECGGVFINGYSASDARVAFGGVKKSGFGRELSHFGLHEFCNVQTVWKNRL